MTLGSENGFAPAFHPRDDDLEKESVVTHQPPNDSLEYNSSDYDGMNSAKDNLSSAEETEFRKREKEKESLLPSSALKPTLSTVTVPLSTVEIVPKTREEIEAEAYSAGAVKSS